MRVQVATCQAGKAAHPERSTIDLTMVSLMNRRPRPVRHGALAPAPFAAVALHVAPLTALISPGDPGHRDPASFGCFACGSQTHIAKNCAIGQAMSANRESTCNALPALHSTGLLHYALPALRVLRYTLPALSTLRVLLAPTHRTY